MKLKLLPFLMLLTVAATAQTLPTDAGVDAPVVSSNLFTAEDTLRAIHNLCRSRRIGGAIMGPPAIAADLIITQIDIDAERRRNSMNSGFSFKPSYGFTLTVYTILTGPFIAVGMHKLIYFSNARETKVMNEFKRSHTLPRKVKKELKPRFFMQPKSK